MIGLGLASSHATAIFCPPEIWPKGYATIPEYTKQSQPHTAKLETMDVIREHKARVDRNFVFLRDQIAAYKPDALIYIGDDQRDLFNISNIPTLAVFTGDEIWGSTAPRYIDEPAEKSRIHVKVHTALAKKILYGLVEREFDVANLGKMQPLGNPDRGMSHMMMYPHPYLVPNNDIPCVAIMLNEYHLPLPSANRCWQLGRALAEILSDGPERVAIYASGGLSHDPIGPRAGWVDEPLDRWFLERLEKNEHEKLKHLFTFDSDTMRGGTGEIRAWITVAAAMDRPATVIDYFPSHHAKTALGWAFWPAKG